MKIWGVGYKMFQFLEPPFCRFIILMDSLVGRDLLFFEKTGMYNFPESMFTTNGYNRAGHSAQQQAHRD